MNAGGGVALVTGGGRGIGRGIALGLAREGWAVAVTARSADQLDETVKLAEGRAMAVAGDIADSASVKRVVREVEKELGPVDLLVNNAGTGGPFGPFWENDPEDWWRCQEVNLRGPMLCCREVLPGMIARKHGRIVNVVSGAGGQAFPDMSAYVASKTALVRLSEQLALEVEPHGVSVFPMRPGLVRTAMVEEGRGRLPFLQKMLDDGMDVAPDVVAGLVVFLASGRADALSGRLFSVWEDAEEIVRQAEDVKARELYLLRARPL
ncbi:MAG: SDR family oxidoreductase [Acidobacteriia bacterium]|nr:SDR family oxidoreductase [Terriglobia bacterium]